MNRWSIHCGLLAAVICNCLSAGVQANSAYSTAVIATTNPTLYWDLEETSGATAADLASGLGGSNNGTFVDLGAATLTLGASGPQPADGFLTMTPDISTPTANNAIGGTHTGTQGVVYLSLATTGGVSTSQYTMAAWFIGDTANFASHNISYVFSRGNGTGTSANLRDAAGVGGAGFSPNKLFLTDGQTVGAADTVDHPVNEWHHLTFVRDDTLATQKGKLYLDGQLRATFDAPWFGGSGEVFTALTRQDYDAGAGVGDCCGLQGRVDEVAVWNRVLSEGEIQSLYDLAFVVPEPTSMSLATLGALSVLLARRRAARCMRSR